MPDAFGAWLAGLISRDEMMERISNDQEMHGA